MNSIQTLGSWMIQAGVIGQGAFCKAATNAAFRGVIKLKRIRFRVAIDKVWAVQAAPAIKLTTLAAGIKGEGTEFRARF